MWFKIFGMWAYVEKFPSNAARDLTLKEARRNPSLDSVRWLVHEKAENALDLLGPNPGLELAVPVLQSLVRHPEELVKVIPLLPPSLRIQACLSARLNAPWNRLSEIARSEDFTLSMAALLLANITDEVHLQLDRDGFFVRFEDDFNALDLERVIEELPNGKYGLACRIAAESGSSGARESAARAFKGSFSTLLADEWKYVTPLIEEKLFTEPESWELTSMLEHVLGQGVQISRAPLEAALMLTERYPGVVVGHLESDQAFWDDLKKHPLRNQDVETLSQSYALALYPELLRDLIMRPDLTPEQASVIFTESSYSHGNASSLMKLSHATHGERWFKDTLTYFQSERSVSALEEALPLLEPDERLSALLVCLVEDPPEELIYVALRHVKDAKGSDPLALEVLRRVITRVHVGTLEYEKVITKKSVLLLPVPMLADANDKTVKKAMKVVSARLGEDAARWEAFYALSQSFEGSLEELLEATDAVV